MAETPTEHPENAPTLGARLRAAREQRGLSVHQAAQELHLSDNLIEALERDEYALLGAPIFVHGHLRNYAHLLGLSADEVVQAYDHAGKRLAAPRLVTMKPSGNPGARRAGVQVFSLIVIAILVALAVVWWRHRIPAPPSAVAVQAGAAPGSGSLASGPLSARTGHVARIPLAVPPAAARNPKASTNDIHAAGGHVPASGASRPAPVVAASVPTRPAGVTAGAVVRAQFSVSQASWIEVYDASGRRLFYNLAPAGDTLNLSGAGPLQVFLGNAPGVSIELNGVPFNFDKFTQANNTARFSLDANAGNRGPSG